MKNVLCTIATAAFVATSVQAGTTPAPAPVGKGKAPVTVAPDPGCPPLSYSYAEAGWLHRDVDGMGQADGGYLDLSFSPVQNFFLDGSVSLIDGDFDQLDLGLGIGGYFPITERIHLVAKGGYTMLDSDEGDTLHGYYLSPGIRAQVTCDLEVYAKAYFNDYDDSGDSGEWSIGGGIVYNFTPQFGLTAGYAVSLEGDDSWQTQLGVRFNF